MILQPSVLKRINRLRPNTPFNRHFGTESYKSSVDDFDKELGTVSVRVGLSYDPLRLSLGSRICKRVVKYDFAPLITLPPPGMRMRTPPGSASSSSNNNPGEGKHL
jgi:hypothetical protein